MTEQDKLQVIAKVVCEHDRVSLADIRKRSRKRIYTDARGKIFLFAQRLTKIKLVDMAAFVNLKAHGTVLSSIRQMDNLINYNGHKEEYLKLREEIKIIIDNPEAYDMEKYLNSMDINF